MHNWRDKCYSGTGRVVSPMAALERPGLVRDGTGVGSTSVGAVVRKWLGWMMGSWRAVGGESGGIAVVGGGYSWLEGDKSVDDQCNIQQHSAAFSTKQHAPNSSQQPTSIPIIMKIHATKVSFLFLPDMDQVVVCGDGDGWLPQQSACIVQEMLPV